MTDKTTRWMTAAYVDEQGSKEIICSQLKKGELFECFHYHKDFGFFEIVRNEIVTFIFERRQIKCKSIELTEEGLVNLIYEGIKLNPMETEMFKIIKTIAIDVEDVCDNMYDLYDTRYDERI